MKTLFTALILSTLTTPVLALNLPVDAVSGVSVEDLGRRSGHCPFRPEQALIKGQAVAREGSICGGV